MKVEFVSKAGLALLLFVAAASVQCTPLDQKSSAELPYENTPLAAFKEEVLEALPAEAEAIVPAVEFAEPAEEAVGVAVEDAVPAEAEVAVPAGDKDEAIVVPADAIVPAVEAIEPTVEAAVPVVEAVVKAVAAAVPAIEAAVPGHKVVAPAAETAVPSAEADVPSAETAVPAAEVDVPAAEAAVPAAEAAIPAVEAVAPAAEAAVAAAVPAVEAVAPVGDLAVEEEQPATLKRALPCDLEACQLPNCRCSSQNLPTDEFIGKEKQIPQFITVTFDDAVNIINYPQYEAMFTGLINPDKCHAHATFFVSHEYTDYTKLNALYNQGHEIALHSITHGQGTDYWRNADIELLKREFGEQLDILRRFAKIDPKNVHGMRLPFLQLSGNNSFLAARELGLEYDCSWPTQQYNDPPMWPYTLDYLSIQDCQIKPCPTASIPGFWVQPMVTWIDTKGYSCSMIDACVYPPADDVDAVYNWILENFMRHYEQNRAPFGMYLHAAWFGRGQHHFAGMRKFLEYANSLPDVYITTPTRVLEWLRKPVLGQPFEECLKKPKTSCRPVTCSLPKENGETHYMTVCDRCPAAYPWLGNPLGKLYPKH